MTTNKDLKEQTITVSITEEGIRNAEGKCPIWDFFEKAFAGFTVKVLRSSVQIFPKRGNRGLYGKLPYEAIEFTHAFDFKLGVKPISFAVDLKR